MRWAFEQLRLPHAAQRHVRITMVYMSAWLSLACCGAPAAADQGVFDAWASWALAPKVWKGQTVLAPEPSTRPSGAHAALNAPLLPLHVQLPLGSSQRQATRALQTLEQAFTALTLRGWPLPPPDGGRGGTLGIDLYLERVDAAAFARVDGPLAIADFDSAMTFAVVAADLPDSQLAPCVQSALAQAGLRASDPSEAESWVGASGELAAWLITGAHGCDGALISGQHAPELGLLNSNPASASAGALFLAVLSERHDNANGGGELVRNLWETTRQRSTGLVPPDRLRSSPDLWEALQKTLSLEQIDLSDELIEFAIARYFAGPSPRRARAAYRVLAALPSDAAVPLTRELSARELPVQLTQQPELSSLGTAYVLVHIGELGSRELQVWLRGEQGPRWSLSAVRLDETGREVGRTSAPARRVPNSYLPVTLEPETTEVLLVITSLPESTPDADTAPPSPHAYDLILALAG
jgi:hypothetical protein